MKKAGTFLTLCLGLWLTAGSCFAGNFEQLSFHGDWNGYTGTSTMAISADGQVVCFDDAQVGVTGLHCRDRATGTTEIISRQLDGTVAAYSVSPTITRDGRYVFYWSINDNILPESTDMFDLYRYDRSTGTTTMIAAGEGGDHWYYPPRRVSISADGRYLVYGPCSNNSTVNYPGQQFRGMVFDLHTGTKIDVRALLPTSIQPSYAKVDPVLSGDGRTLVFSGNELPAYSHRHAYMIDLETSVLTDLSAQGDLDAQYNCSFHPTHISDDGQRVLLSNWCYPGWPQLYDAADGSYTNLCTTPDGQPAAQGCSESHMSANGRVVIFRTYGDDLAPDNANPNLGGWVVRFLDENRLDWAAVNDQEKYVNTNYPELSANGDFLGFITFEILADTDTPPFRDVDRDHYIYERSSIALKQATYNLKKGELDLSVTSRLGADAGLILDGIGPMSYKSGTWSWIGLLPATPANVTVRGVEGASSFPVTLK